MLEKSRREEEKKGPGSARTEKNGDFPMPGKRKSRRLRRHRRQLAAAVMILLILSVGIGITVAGLPAPIQAWLDIQPDKHAVNGRLHDLKAREVSDQDFWVVLNQLPTLEEGSRECNIEYENPSSNHDSARLSLYLREETAAEAGNQAGAAGADAYALSLIGHTRRVDPGHYVEYIHLTRDLPAGEYPVLAKLELFQGTTPVGAMTLEITLRITAKDHME